MEETIRLKLLQALQPEYLLLLNDSHKHSVPKGSETHFTLLIVAQAFEGLPRVQRQRKIYEILKQELAGPVHALAIKALSPLEWEESEEHKEFASPPCLGGSKHKK